MTDSQGPGDNQADKSNVVRADREYNIGSEVFCSDGVCGELRRVVVDPVARSLTHIVVEGKHRQGIGRLVPVGLVASSGEEIHLSCTTAQFEALEEAEETHFLAGASGEWGYRQDQMLSQPYYGLGMGYGGGMAGMGMAGMGMGGIGMGGMGMGGMGGLDGLGMDGASRPVVSDRVPVGEVEVRRGEPVHATDGPIGRVQGLVVDPGDNHVTHVLLDEGHLWGKKRVAVPIGAVKKVDAGVQLDLTKDEVRDLPEIELAE